MLSLAWVEHQIEQAKNGLNEPQNVRDYALLCIARDFLKSEQNAHEQRAASGHDRVVLTDYSADLNRVPNPEEIKQAIAAAASAAYTPESRQQLRDMNTWAGILGNAEKS